MRDQSRRRDRTATLDVFAVDWAVLPMTVPDIHDMLIAAIAPLAVFWCKVLRLQLKWMLPN